MCLGTDINLVVADWAAWTWSVRVWAVVDWGGVNITLTSALTVSDIVMEVIEDGVIFVKIDVSGGLCCWSTEGGWVGTNLREPVDLKGVEDLDWVLSLNLRSSKSVLNLGGLNGESIEDIVSKVIKSPLEVIEGIIAVVEGSGSGLKDVILLFLQESLLIIEWCVNLLLVLSVDLI